MEQPAISVMPGAVLWLPRRRPGVVAVRLAGLDRQDERWLASLQARLAAELQEAELYAPDRRSFLAHVTVARVRRGTRVRPVALEGPDLEPFALSTVTLFRSHLGRGGARYEPLTRVPLLPA
jgi:2'-5' RNA ligase